MKEFIDKLISRLDELIEDSYYRCMDGSLSAGNENGAYHNVKDIVNELAEEYINTSTEHINCSTKVSEMPTGWIPCSERLPEEYGEYLVCNKYGVYGLGFPNKDKYGNIYVETESEYITEVIAWMPLPAPYKEGEQIW